MVFKTLVLCRYQKGPDEFWRKRKIFRLAAHFTNRTQNCYKLSIRAVHRALQLTTLGRKLKKVDFKLLWRTRLNGPCNEMGYTQPLLMDSLTKCDVMLNRKTLSDLAIWEPRTFKCLTDVALARAKADGMNMVRHLDPPAGVITRGMLK